MSEGRRSDTCPICGAIYKAKNDVGASYWCGGAYSFTEDVMTTPCPQQRIAALEAKIAALKQDAALGKAFTALLDSLKPEEVFSIGREDNGLYWAQLLENNLDGEAPAERNGIECDACDYTTWKAALVAAGLIAEPK